MNTPQQAEYVLTVDQAAELFSVTPKQVREWIRTGMPVLKAGGKGAGNGAQINAPDAIAWVVARRRRRRHLVGTQERARRDSETADKLAMENAETRSDLARPEVMRCELDRMFAFHRKNLMALLAIAPQLVGLSTETIRARLEDAVYGVLNRLADYRPGRHR